MAETWTPEARAAYMHEKLSMLNDRGVWAMTMGVWKKLGPKDVELMPLISRMHPNAVEICRAYADDARRAGYTVTLTTPEDMTERS